MQRIYSKILLSVVVLVPFRGIVHRLIMQDELVNYKVIQIPKHYALRRG